MPPLTNVLKDGFDVTHASPEKTYEDGDYLTQFYSKGSKRVLLRPGDVEGYNIAVTGELDDAEWWVYTRASDDFEDDDRIYYADGFHDASAWHLIEPKHSLGDNLVLWRAQEDDRETSITVSSSPTTISVLSTDATGSEP